MPATAARLLALSLLLAPASAAAVDFTFAIWSDTHFRAEGGSYRDDAAQDIATLAGTPYPPAIGGSVGAIEFVLVPGDITENSYYDQYENNNGITNDDFLSCVGHWFTMPVYEITGNHDSYNEPGRTLIRDAIAGRHGSTSYSFDYAGVHFIGLDSGSDDVNPFNASALDYLEAHMLALPTEQAVIIYCHYPGQDGPHAQWDRVYDAIEGYNVVLLCNGHEHYPRVANWRGFDYLVTSDCKVVHGNQAFSVVRVTDAQLTAVAYDWYNNAWRTDALLAKPIAGVGPWFSTEVVNPSFEEAGGSLDGWQVIRPDGKGPDNPPQDNDNPYGPQTPFGDHFAGKITNWGTMDFTLGQIIEVADYDPGATELGWALSAYVQLHSRTGTTPYPENVRQTWEIGWNDDGSAPANVNQCDQYTTVADIDANHTGNDPDGFRALSAQGTITGVTGLRYLAFRVRMYNLAGREWSMNNIDNVGFEAPPPGPKIGLNPPAFQRSIWIGDDLPDDAFTVANIGIDVLGYTISDDAAWLSVWPVSGASSGEVDPIEVSYQVADLQAGVHTATITVASPDAWNSPQTVPVMVIVETVAPDFDGDGDVDQEDFGHLQACLTGPGIQQNLPACLDARLDADQDVDANDFAILQACLSGSAVRADPDCAN